MRVKEHSNQFKYNYEGVLDHTGCIKVAKGDRKFNILYVDKEKNTVLLQGKKNSFVARVHAELKDSMIFCDESDTGFVKFRKDGAWLVGFQKLKQRFIAKKIQQIVEENNLKIDKEDIVGYWKVFGELDKMYADYEVDL